jgi:hypothetical protein
MNQLNYKAYLCQLIEDLGGEVTIPKSTINDHHVLHFFEDDDDIIIVSEIMDK